MKRYLLASLVCGFVGAYAALALHSSGNQFATNAVAQDVPLVNPNGGNSPQTIPSPFSQGRPFPNQRGLINDIDIHQRKEAQTTASHAATRTVNSGYTPDELINIQVYEQGNRSAVNITTRSPNPDAFFFQEQAVEGAGSGAVLDKAGHILTNFHVIEGAREVYVTLFNGETHEANVVGFDSVNDIAVLQVDVPQAQLFPVTFGDSRQLKVGQRVFAIGNPFGLERTMTTGIISSLNRSIPSRRDRTMKSIIQLDAALNSGNSGGPLLDSRGMLIGMNTAIASKTGQNTGVGFAIPASTISRIVPQLIENGRVIRPTIGITQAYQTDDGLLIVEMAPGGPAERAGLKGFRLVRERQKRGPYIYERTRVDRSQADLILSVDGKRTTTKDEFLTAIESKRPGDQVSIKVQRDSGEETVVVTLGAGD